MCDRVTSSLPDLQVVPTSTRIASTLYPALDIAVLNHCPDATDLARPQMRLTNSFPLDWPKDAKTDRRSRIQRDWSWSRQPYLACLLKGLKLKLSVRVKSFSLLSQLRQRFVSSFCLRVGPMMWFVISRRPGGHHRRSFFRLPLCGFQYKRRIAL